MKIVNKRKLSPIVWLGNKSKIAIKLFKHFPDHEIFVDAFAGSGEISLQSHFLNKNLKKLILNDANETLYEIYNLLKDHINEFILEYEKLSKGITQEKAKKIANEFQFYENSFKKSISYIFLLKNSYKCNIKTVRDSIEKSEKNTNKTYKLRLILANRIFNKYQAEFYNQNIFDFLNTIQKKESLSKDKTFIYCDPPYFKTSKNNYAKIKWTEKELANLIIKLNSMGFKYAISECFQNVDVFKKFGLNIFFLKTRRNISNRMTEILATNY